MSESTTPDTQTPESQLQKIRIVLVNTTHPGNIGGVARAMKNMGLSQLYLVEPRDFPADKAVWRAAGAVDVLDNAIVVETLDDAVADCGLVVGTSARERRIPWPLVTPRECGERAVAEARQHDVAIVFGREDRGLTNEELHKCNYHVHIPANPDYSALNLAAAVQVVSYEVRMAWLTLREGRAPHFEDWDQPPADHQALEMYYQHLQETLESLSFIEPGNPRQTMTRLRRLYSRIRLDQMELSILRGMLTSIQNYIFHSDNKIKALRGETPAEKK
ncbi:MAG: tRNA (cytosine(32)/uridine(32)-2'-O)-methyltransferase TrmJ [Gammaproteobacteria bacterium]|uniref:tRNA (cytosine(32)/uridine(32)-2'-O)-methyltransferase TrmJ n=1 Tax=Pseudomaricurvus alcaniphilus TaxID=1166482 RepID=UPI00140A7D9F|nr:tRNA (cytosine(32)/uridine(32)-2'-O)-methyltransferase TrmJ [Pseudomaricurvus alcaniphilus]MBR9911191.1 tRNA (cytosine(32)/uridine(32)-2'-O)-methyltransferase TrmJ [Gammaproteobacteria bacterium]NHN37570.1 tRNA (cytosine(32)/uridine(32)-2'-O)-methyltransferase TrmJ [Pseudomaricurvus alcaniphilus]